LAFRINNDCDDAAQAAVVLAATSSRIGATPTASTRAHETGCVHLLVAVGGEDSAGSVTVWRFRDR